MRRVPFRCRTRQRTRGPVVHRPPRTLEAFIELLEEFDLSRVARGKPTVRALFDELADGLDFGPDFACVAVIFRLFLMA